MPYRLVQCGVEGVVGADAHDDVAAFDAHGLAQRVGAQEQLYAFKVSMHCTPHVPEDVLMVVVKLTQARRDGL